uniref:RXYLT1 C-terminal domain-containing protein n=1 Tax=viral metagenome TaxID=1070528 RepID=A0A6C0KPT4_9ZZZZ
MNKQLELDLGWSQGYMGLQYHMEEALEENELDPSSATCNPPIALFSKNYYNQINELNHDKIYDYCFIGSFKTNLKARRWARIFAKKYFTSNSIFINTDNPPNWAILGPFDYTNQNFGFVPKKQKNNQSKQVQYRVVNENIDYFQKMSQSKFVLCPAGDSSWSFRFYECLMCKSIPIVESWHHTYRTKEESDIKYKYILQDRIDQPICYDDYVKENTRIFEKYHMIQNNKK